MPAKINSASGSTLICEHNGEVPAGIFMNPSRCGLIAACVGAMNYAWRSPAFSGTKLKRKDSELDGGSMICGLSAV